MSNHDIILNVFDTSVAKNNLAQLYAFDILEQVFGEPSLIPKTITRSHAHGLLAQNGHGGGAQHADSAARRGILRSGCAASVSGRSL